MSNFTFIHTADWQIGKPFGEFAGDKPGVLRQARLEAIDRIADVARQRGAGHVLAAGDLFDFATGSTPLVRQVVQRLAAHRDIAWHLISGNHDPARPASVWDDVRAAAPPANVVLHLEPQATEIARGVVLLPAPLKAKSSVSDPTDWMDEAPTPAGCIRIGMAHGSVTGFGSEGDAAVPIDPARPRRAGLCYLALGDWHGTKKIADRVWYSGTPEPDSFQDNDPGHVLSVTIAGADSIPHVERIRTAKHTWAQRDMRIAAASDLDPLLAELSALGPAAPHHLLQLTLAGRVALAHRLEINAQLSGLEARLFHLASDLSGLAVMHETADLAQFASGAVRIVAERLSTEARGADEERARIAAAALIKLADIANTTASSANKSSAA